MNEQPFAISIEEMYGDPGLDDAAIEVILARSLDPRPATMLYAKMGELGLRADHRTIGAERSHAPLSRLGGGAAQYVHRLF